MGFSIETSVPILTVFIQGLLSFFSPCVFPIIPLYLSYLAGGSKRIDEKGQIHYPKKKVFINTFFFVLGISFTFFLLGFGFTALGQFFNSNKILFARISGIIMVLFGLYQFGIFGRSQVIDREHRLMFNFNKWSMGPIPALLLGFTFSFAWTPCVGPVLGSVMLMAGNASTATNSIMLIGVYTLGFTLPFFLVGIFTTTILEFFKKHGSIVKYTVKIGAVLLVFMGIMTFTGFMNNLTGYLSNFGTPSSPISQNTETNENTESQRETESNKETKNNEEAKSNKETENTTSETTDSSEKTTEPEKLPAPDFTLTDQNGNTHKLSDYKGKTVFLNFWATWCSPCKGEMPDIQKLYESYGYNKEDLIVLGVAGPNQGNEGSIQHITDFLSDNKYSFPVVMDETGSLFTQYGIRAFPTTFMIDKEGNVFGYVASALTSDMMNSIVEQTMSGKRTP